MPETWFFRVSRFWGDSIKVELRERRRFFGSRVLAEVLVSVPRFRDAVHAVKHGKRRVVYSYRQILAYRKGMDAVREFYGDSR
ncbi:hypothetical protein [Streptomyces sp. NPDC002644]